MYGEISLILRSWSQRSKIIYENLDRRFVQIDIGSVERNVIGFLLAVDDHLNVAVSSEIVLFDERKQPDVVRDWDDVARKAPQVTRFSFQEVGDDRTVLVHPTLVALQCCDS